MPSASSSVRRRECSRCIAVVAVSISEAQPAGTPNDDGVILNVLARRRQPLRSTAIIAVDAPTTPNSSSCGRCARECYRHGSIQLASARSSRTRPRRSARCRQRHRGVRIPSHATPASRRTRSRTHPVQATLAASATLQGSRGWLGIAPANIPFPARCQGQIFTPRTPAYICLSAGSQSPVDDPSEAVRCKVAVQAAQPPARSARTACGQWLPELSVVVCRIKRTTNRRHDSSASPDSHAVTREGRTEVT